jgi:hypothetical protein
MGAPKGNPLFRAPMRTYTAYSIGCAIAWAALWVILALTSKKGTLNGVLLVFIGWMIGWTSATLARSLYPPPKKMLLAGLTSEQNE